jgi:hypothetical protein
LTVSLNAQGALKVNAFDLPLLQMTDCCNMYAKILSTATYIFNISKRAPFQLLKAEVPQGAIMKQLGMFKATLMRILSGRERLLSHGL